MPRAKYLYHLTPQTTRPLNTMEDVAEHSGISVHVLRHRFAMGAECIEVDGVTVCRKRVVCDSKYARWWESKRREYGTRRAYDKARKQDTDSD